MSPTHEVLNQPAPLVDRNLLVGNVSLRDAVHFNARELNLDELTQLGERAGSHAMQEHARLANVHTPRLLTHDRFGHRVDQVEFHPSYHALMDLAVSSGLHGAPWAEGAHAHVRRAAGFMLFT
ncbi:MAG: DNA alkylation response protein, partial [Cytophagales bacterium]|nr:DNA alkylation response protein [Rhizobacter sp.]